MFCNFLIAAQLSAKPLTNPHLERYKTKLLIDKALVKQNPKDPIAHKNYAHTLYLIGNNSKAAEYYEKAQKLSPQDAAASNELGNTYRNLQKYSQAITAYQQAITLQPQQINAYVNLANLYLTTLQQKEQGYAVYAQAVHQNAGDR